jgi:MFS family permease
MIRAILHDYPRRAVLGLVLMTAQAFFYNAIFFTYALVLTRFYQVPSAAIGWYVLPFALGNFLGPLVLGPFFDTLGRKPMIAGTYALSGVLLALVGYLFRQDLVDAATLTVCWSGIFFFASAAASAAYLTVSESFPLEARALGIAFFYAVGTAIGGVVGEPAVYTVSRMREQLAALILDGQYHLVADLVPVQPWGVASRLLPG